MTDEKPASLYYVMPCGHHQRYEHNGECLVCKLAEQDELYKLTAQSAIDSLRADLARRNADLLAIAEAILPAENYRIIDPGLSGDVIVRADMAALLAEIERLKGGAK